MSRRKPQSAAAPTREERRAARVILRDALRNVADQQPPLAARRIAVPAAVQLPQELAALLPDGTTGARIVSEGIDPRARRVLLVEGQHGGRKAWFVIKEILGLLLGPFARAAAQQIFTSQVESSNKGAA